MDQTPIDRSKRLTFDQAAETYAAARPGYPEELVQAVLNLSGIKPGGRILEIGCGPGNASLPFARRGYQILGIEIGGQLAAIASRNLSPYPGVRIINSAFEDWELEPDAFDLALAADAFHWIAPEIGYPKVARALKASGSLDFFWNVPVDPHTDWSSEIASLYAESEPPFVNPDTRFSAEWLIETVTRAIQASGRFGEVTTRQVFWTVTESAGQYISGLRTFSMHAGVNEEAREKLYTKIKAVIERFGGRVEQPCSAILFHAPVRK